MLVDDAGGSVGSNMMRWALEHSEEWDIVLGFKKADTEKTLYIGNLLREAGFAELPEMMAMRAYRILAECDGQGS